MSKRRAATQLTRDDLDREDSPDEREQEPEYEGSGVASAEVLSKRKIITARRSLNSSSSGSARSSPFGSLNLLTSTGTASGSTSSSLFASSSTSGAAAAPLSAITSSSMPLAFGAAGHKYQPLVPSPLTKPSASLTNGSTDTPVAERERDAAFYQKMRALNQSFQQHMTSHLSKDPEADYSHNCEEYINYIRKLHTQFPIRTVTTATTESASEPKQTVSESQPEPKETPAARTTIPESVASSSTEATDRTADSKTSQAAAVTSTPFSSGFKFPASSSLSFGATQSAPAFGSGFGSFATSSLSTKSFSAPAAASKEETGDDDEYVPPKNEEINSEEEDAVYSKK